MFLQHKWEVTPAEAQAIQAELSTKVCLEPFEGELKYIAGADVSFNKFSETIYAGLVVLDASNFQEVERSLLVAESKFPYIPGFLSFREAPALAEAWHKLKNKPNLIILDGQGIAHPRGLGIASHLGLLLDVPTIGCAKSVLVGKYQEPKPERGSWEPLIYRQQTVGAALRTKGKTNPVFVSPGHKTDLESSLKIVLDCCRGYRLPETTRLAHKLVNQLRLGEIEETSQTEETLRLF